MILGILKDIKQGENRVICTPLEVEAIISAGHTVIAQKGCGEGAGFDDEGYSKAGATLAESTEEIFERCDIVVKVKELDTSEYALLREGQIIYCCLHPAANKGEVDALLKSRCISFSAEDSHRYGSPNCEAAGKQGALFGLESMLTINGGKGKFAGGFAGAPSMRVLILGGGLVGRGALEVLYALGAKVCVMDINAGVLRELKEDYHGKIDTLFCTKEGIAELLPQTDMVINCVKWPKHRKDFLIDRKMLSLMEKGSVLVDISNDNPGAIETSRPTTHENPRYVVDGVVHYCVDNIPSAVAHSVSVALAADTLPLLLKIMNKGAIAACKEDEFLCRALTTYYGELTHKETAKIQNRQLTPLEDIFCEEA